MIHPLSRLLSLSLGLLLAMSTAGAVTAAEAIDFRVTMMEDPGSEGPSITRPYVTVGKRKLIFRQPQNCRLSSSAEALTLLFTTTEMNGQISVTNSPFTPEKDLATEAEAYHVHAESTLPDEVEKLEFVGAKAKLYVGLQKNLAFEWKYSHFAHPTYRQVTYLNLDETHQVMITIVCEENSEQAITGFARRFFTSWYWGDDGAPAKAAGPDKAGRAKGGG